MKKKNEFTVLLVFLLGIFLGAIDSGIVSPARTIITNSFGTTESLGVWMITIYSLAYAVSMPIASKLSDRYGRKKVYLISIIIFTLGSALCGLNNFYGNFTLFLVSRIIQAIGGGGIMPIATAYIGSSFSPEKRGTALGFVGAIFGIATILGPTLGSWVLDIAGTNHWGWIFFMNIPITIAILFLSNTISESKAEQCSKMDYFGSIILSVVVLSIMYSLTNLDFFNFTESIKSTKVWPFLMIFFIAIPIFVLIEKKAEDPVLNIKYFQSPQIAFTLIISFITGCGLMGVVFIPQFSENVLKLKTGNGGYIVTLMAFFSGLAAPLGGKIIDKYSAKLILLLGFSCTIIGTLILALYVTAHPSFIPILFGLIFVGFGMGFTMGTPLNYLMLSYVSEKESAAALSTLSLVRSIGLTISPNIMINFIADAGRKMQNNLQLALPTMKPPVIAGFENMSGKFKMNSSMSNMKLDGNVSSAALKKLQSSDVTTIVENTKYFVSSLFDTIIPKIQNNIYTGINKGLTAIHTAQHKMYTAIDGMNKAIAGMTKAETGINKGIMGMSKAKAGISQGITGMSKAKAGISKGIEGMSKAKVGMSKGIDGMEMAKTKMQDALNQMQNTTSMPSNGNVTDTMSAMSKNITQNLSANMPSSSTGMPHNMMASLTNTKGSVPSGIVSSFDGNVPQVMPTNAPQVNPTMPPNMPNSGSMPNISDMKAQLTSQIDVLNNKINATTSQVHILDKKISAANAQIDLLTKKIHAAANQVHTFDQKISAASNQIHVLQNKVNTLASSKIKLQDAINTMSDKMSTMSAAKHNIPNIMTNWRSDYIHSIDLKRSSIETMYQSTLNGGFKNMFIAAAVIAAIGLIFTIFLKKKTAPLEEL